MAKLVKYIDKDGDIDVTNIDNDTELKDIPNIIEISKTLANFDILNTNWAITEYEFKIDKPVYKVTYNYDSDPVNPVTEFYSTNDIIVAIARNAQFRYNIGNYTYENLAHDYGYDPDYDNVSMKLIRKLNKTGYCNFISVYDHSAHSYFLGYSRGWDISCIGLIYIPYSTCADGEQYAKDLLKEITAYANGDCYIYSIDKLVNDDWDNVASCSGFYNKDHCIEYVKDELNSITKNDTDPLIITIDNTY